MSAGVHKNGAADASGFGKRGKVRLTPPGPGPSPAQEPPGGFGGAFSSIPNPVKWAGGGLAALAVVVMLGLGGGGGGFLGGLLGGLLAWSLFSNTSAPATTTARPGVTPGGTATAPAHDVARGGFGATSGAHGSASS